MGYDGSPAGHASLLWAIETARLGGQGVRTLVVDPDNHAPSGPGERQPDDDVAARAQEVLIAARASGTVKQVSGEVVPVLLQAAAHADMLVVGSTGHGWLAEAVRGSVSQLLARHAPCPTVVVRPGASRRAARIVVGVDGSEESRAALEFAARRADLTKESVVALHAWNAGHVDVDRHGQLPSSVGERAHVAELALAEASATASLVVTGSRGHGLLTGMLLGSVSHRLLNRARCPVAVVR